MEITWVHIIYLAEKMWETTQNEIAQYLDVKPSTISRLKSGRTLYPRFEINYVYDKLFSPSIASSPAYHKNPQELLGFIKDIIKEAGLDEATKTLDDSDYEKFVTGLIKLAKSPKNKTSTSQNISSHNITISTKKKPELQDIPNDSYQSLKNYPIEDSRANSSGDPLLTGNNGAQLSISQNCRICACCNYWDGNTQNSHVSKLEVPGNCIWQKEVTLSLANCKYFTPNYGKITMREFFLKPIKSTPKK